MYIRAFEVGLSFMNILAMGAVHILTCGVSTDCVSSHVGIPDQLLVDEACKLHHGTEREAVRSRH